MRTMVDISQKLLKYTVISALACLLWNGEARADKVTSCGTTASLKAAGSTSGMATYGNECTTSASSCATNNSSIQSAETYRNRDSSGCFQGMPIQGSVSISSIVGARPAGIGATPSSYQTDTVTGTLYRQHAGMDVGAACGTKLEMPADGWIDGISWECRKVYGSGGSGKGAGNYVVFKHPMNPNSNDAKTGCKYYYTRFFHMQALYFTEGGSFLKQGTVFGEVGGTNCNKGVFYKNGYDCHMHMELHKCSLYEDSGGILLNPLCSNNQNLCNGAVVDGVSPADPDANGGLGSGGGSGSGGGNRGPVTNPYLSEIEDCCKYASDACKQATRDATASASAGQPQQQTPAPQNDKIIFVGDSRTVGMCAEDPRTVNGGLTRKIVNKTDGAAYDGAGAVDGVRKQDGNYCYAIEGVNKAFLDTAIPKVNSIMDDYGTIVIALGVNDLNTLTSDAQAEDAATRYLNKLQSAASAWQAAGKKVYFSLVTRVNESMTNHHVKNSCINAFNNKMKAGLSGLGISVIDATSSVTDSNFSGGDGLHNSNKAAVYNTIVSQVKNGGMGTAGGGISSTADGSICSTCTDKTDEQKKCERKNDAIKTGGIFCETTELSPTWKTDCLKGEGCKKTCAEKYPLTPSTDYSDCIAACDKDDDILEACKKSCGSVTQGATWSPSSGIGLPSYVQEDNDKSSQDCVAECVAKGGSVTSSKKADVAGQCFITVGDNDHNCSDKTGSKSIDPAITDAINEAAAKYNISPMLIASIINIESVYNPSAQNGSTTAAGLGQFLKSTWEDVCKSSGYGDFYTNRYEIKPNVMCIGAYLDRERTRISNKSLYKNNNIDMNDNDLLIYAYFQGGGTLDNAIRAYGSQWKEHLSAATSINKSGAEYLRLAHCHMSHIADRNGCEGGTGAFGQAAATCPLPSDCKDYHFDPSFSGSSYGGGSGGGSAGTLEEEHTCNISESYNNIKGCIFCNLFRVIYDTASIAAKKCHNLFAQSMILLLGIGLAIVIAMIVLKYISSWTQQEWSQMLNELFQKIFLIVFLILLLKIDVTQFFNMFVTPIFNTGLKFASLIMGSTSCDTSLTGTVNGIGLPEEMGQSMLCAILSVQQRLEKMMALGSNAICLAFYHYSFKFIIIFPHFGYLLTGLFLWLIALIFMLIYPFLLVDSVIQFGIASSLFPVALAATGFKLTSKYLNIWKIVNIFISAMFNFVFLTTILFILLKGIDKSVSPIIEQAYSSAGGNFFNLDTLAWYSKHFILIVFYVFLGKSVLKYIPEFANEYAKSITGDNGTTNLDIGKKLGGTAVNAAAQAGKTALGIGKK